ncbi:MAG: hypothetical protein ABIF10_05440 [Candidatus Woesearchaeota archaeon]
MKGISAKEMELVSYLEFHEKYFFSSEDADRFSRNTFQRYNLIKNLLAKKRIIKLNRNKYYLVPVKAKTGSWAEDSFILVDEMCNGKDYLIGGWAAANYWHLTEQVPMQVDVYTTRRQGKKEILSARIVFHRTSKKKIAGAVRQHIGGHGFMIQGKEASRKWLISRD